MDQEAVVVEFPRSPGTYIGQIADRCPAFAAVAEKVSSRDGDTIRTQAMVAELFRRTLHFPRMTREEADAVLDHGSVAADVTEEELARLGGDPERRCIHDIWQAVWDGETDAEAVEKARYCAALLARLYRLEPVVRAEALRDAACAL